MSKVVDFYLEISSNLEGYFIYEIWSFDDEQIETNHSFIQWLFPLSELSNFNPDAPLLTEDDIKVFKANLSIQNNLTTSFQIYLNFLGLNYDGEEVTKAENFMALLFMHPNHNWFRITRVLKSLKLLGLEKEAMAFYKCLKKIHEDDGLVSDNSFSYWTEAVN